MQTAKNAISIVTASGFSIRFIPLQAKFTLRLIIILLNLWAANQSFATPFIPESADTVVAQWPLHSTELLNRSNTADDSNAALAAARAYMQQAMLPGQSNLYGRAQAVLAPVMAKHPASAEFWLTWAQLLQHQHQFSSAKQALDEVFARDPHNVTASLLAARIALIQGNAAQAKRHCISLLGRSELVTVSACALEAASYSDKASLQSSYAQLRQLATGTFADAEQGIWLQQILADMALRLDQPQAALNHLTPMPAQASVSLWSQWAGVQLALHNYEELLSTLGTLVRALSDQDDALLVRLALAEKRLSPGEYNWQQLITEKIHLREQRGDTQHAADMCLFYLDISPDPQKALQWAKQNWQQAQEPADRILLARAQAAALNQGH
ncbi:MAG TPA: tetratricopeptide repeat protein [Cellvibrionaceae bacterium]